MFLGDPCHGLWADCLNSAKACNMYSTILIAGIVFNLAYGPWNGEAWFQSVIESSLDFHEVSKGMLDPLFIAFLPLALTDMCSAEIGFDEDLRRGIWESLKECRCLRIKGPRQCQSRWFSWHKCMSFWTHWWHRRGLFLVFLGVQINGLCFQSWRCHDRGWLE